jgi:hypothetical protein
VRMVCAPLTKQVSKVLAHNVAGAIDPLLADPAWCAQLLRPQERSSLNAQSPLNARILPVEHTIRRWRVGTGQHAS